MFGLFFFNPSKRFLLLLLQIATERREGWKKGWSRDGGVWCAVASVVSILSICAPEGSVGTGNGGGFWPLFNITTFADRPLDLLTFLHLSLAV